MESEHRSAISVVFVLLLAGTMTAVAVAPEPQAQTAQVGNATGSATTISVSASGDVQAEPDVAVLHLESAATAEEPQTATDRLAANTSRLRSALLTQASPRTRFGRPTTTSTTSPNGVVPSKPRTRRDTSPSRGLPST